MCEVGIKSGSRAVTYVCCYFNLKLFNVQTVHKILQIVKEICYFVRKKKFKTT